MADERGTAGLDRGAAEGLLFGGVAALVSLTLVLLVGIAIYGVGFGNLGGNDGAEEIESQVEVGRAVYSARCASCHGAGGEGLVGPAFTGVSSKYPDPAQQERVVQEGRNQMPAFADLLSAEEIAAVVAYEREVLDRTG